MAHTVRDGIYKDLPLPKPWRSLMRGCLRPAERGETTRRLAERALQRDANQELSPVWVRRFCALCSDSTQTLPGIETPLSSASTRDLGGFGTPLERLAFDSAQDLQRRGVYGLSLATEAMTDAFDKWGMRQYRHMEQHGFSKAGDEVRPTLRAARQALDGVDNRAIAQRVISGESSVRSKARESINLDEDLTKPK